LELVKPEPGAAIYGHHPYTQSRFEGGDVELGSPSLHFINHCDGQYRWESQVKNLSEYKEARLEVGSICQAYNYIGPLSVGIRSEGLHHHSFIIRRRV
jgi:hypothetical protein